MATLCKNCGSGLEFDPKTQKLICKFCGSSFYAEEVEAYDKELLENKQPERLEYMDCYVYSCTQCGGEIIINGTEVSTACIYCGSTNVVFNRISKFRRPHEILPFQITKEQALDHIRKEIDKAHFIPDEIKKFKPDNIRGIYIPYWIASAEHSDAAIIKGSEEFKREETIYFGRAGTMTLKDLALDGSTMLANELSDLLQPYSLSACVPFDEDYLQGFYSDASDVTFGEIKGEAFRRLEESFNKTMIDEVRGLPRTIMEHEPYTVFKYEDLRYVMLPVWFATFTFEGQHNVILVNGQTSKVVCALPWNKKKYNACVAITGAILSILAFLFFCPIISAYFHSAENTDIIRDLPYMLIFVALPIGLLAGAIMGLKKVKERLSLTQSNTIFNFVKKRQE